MANKKLFNIYNNPKNSSNFIVAACIGKKAITSWKKYSANLWIKYCKRNNLGLLVFHDYIIPKSDKNWKSATWQKHLFGSYIKKKFKKIKNICLLDIDILINPYSPNIFNFQKKDKISVVSQVASLPYQTELKFIKRKIAFLRHNYYSKNFPLDSSLTMVEKDIYAFHGFKKRNQYFCAGVIMFNLEKYSKFMSDSYYSYRPNEKSITGGNEPFINNEVLSKCKVNWLDYRFQTIWQFELVEKYPFLYKLKNKKSQLVKECVESSLENCYFLHFSGQWFDSKHMEIKDIFNSRKFNLYYSKYLVYKKAKLKNKVHKLRIVPRGADNSSIKNI